MSMIFDNTFKLMTVKQLGDTRPLMSGTTGATVGTFDLFHAGHLDFLEWSKRIMDTLIVGVKSDAFCNNNTLYPEKDRLDILSALPYVDILCLVDDVKEFIEAASPEIYVKGPPHNFETLCAAEKEALPTIKSADNKTDVQIKFGALSRNISKKSILEKIYDTHPS